MTLIRLGLEGSGGVRPAFEFMAYALSGAAGSLLVFGLMTLAFKGLEFKGLGSSGSEAVSEESKV